MNCSILYAVYDSTGARTSDVLCLDCLADALKKNPLSPGEYIKRVQEEEHKRCEWCAEEV